MWPPMAGGEAALVVTEDTTLDHDIPSGCEAGIEIGAPGITLDLAGHSVAGRDYGIRNRGHDDVTIQNGRWLRMWRLLSSSGAEHNVLRGFTARTDSARRSVSPTPIATDSPPRPRGYLEGIGLHDGSDATSFTATTIMGASTGASGRWTRATTASSATRSPSACRSACCSRTRTTTWSRATACSSSPPTASASTARTGTSVSAQSRGRPTSAQSRHPPAGITSPGRAATG